MEPHVPQIENLDKNLDAKLTLEQRSQKLLNGRVPHRKWHRPVQASQQMEYSVFDHGWLNS